MDEIEELKEKLLICIEALELIASQRYQGDGMAYGEIAKEALKKVKNV